MSSHHEPTLQCTGPSTPPAPAIPTSLGNSGKGVTGNALPKLYSKATELLPHLPKSYILVVMAQQASRFCLRYLCNIIPLLNQSWLNRTSDRAFSSPRVTTPACVCLKILLVHAGWVSPAETTAVTHLSPVGIIVLRDGNSLSLVLSQHILIL